MAKRQRAPRDRREQRSGTSRPTPTDPTTPRPPTSAQPRSDGSGTTGTRSTVVTGGATTSSAAAKAEARRVRAAERAAADKAARRKQGLVRAAALAVGGALLAAALWFGLDLGRPQLGIEQPFEGGVGQHLEEGAALPQRNRPPSSGPHYGSRAQYGSFATPVAPGQWIHVLEHGGMALLFKCNGEAECGQKADEIRTQVYDKARNGRHGARKITATPYQEMEAPYTAVVWGRILPLQSLDAAQILAFYERYLDRGPEDAA